MIRRHVLSVALVVGALAACSPGASGTFIDARAPISVTLPNGATSLAFTAAGQNATIGVSETGYTGTFTAASSNAAVATVSPATAATFNVTAVAGGSATITISDSLGDHAQVAVGVTTITGVISAR